MTVHLQPDCTEKRRRRGAAQQQMELQEVDTPTIKPVVLQGVLYTPTEKKEKKIPKRITIVQRVPKSLHD